MGAGRSEDRVCRRPIRAARKKKPTSRSAMTSACSKATSVSRTRGSWTSNTKQATRITEGTAYTVQGAPSWSPDGKRFVFGAGVTPMLRDNRRDVYVATLGVRPTGQQASRLARSKRSAPIGATTASRAGRRTAATIAWVGEPNTTAPLPDGTAVGRGDAAAPDALQRQREDHQGHADADLRQRRRQPGVDQRRHARDVRHRQARLQRSVRLRPDVGHLHAADAEAHASTARRSARTAGRSS